MWCWTGNALEGFDAQRHWGVQSVGNILNLPKFLSELLSPTEWHEMRGSVLDRSVFALMLCLMPAIWRLDKVWFAWTLVLGVLPAMSGDFVSFTRFTSVVYPLFPTLAILLTRPGRAFLKIPILATFALAHAALLWRFLNYRWAG
jgi:hypothetical protein